MYDGKTFQFTVLVVNLVPLKTSAVLSCQIVVAEKNCMKLRFVHACVKNVYIKYYKKYTCNLNLLLMT
jgi:hypothetical protein